MGILETRRGLALRSHHRPPPRKSHDFRYQSKEIPPDPTGGSVHVEVLTNFATMTVCSETRENFDERLSSPTACIPVDPALL